MKFIPTTLLFSITLGAAFLLISNEEARAQTAAQTQAGQQQQQWQAQAPQEKRSFLSRFRRKAPAQQAQAPAQAQPQVQAQPQKRGLNLRMPRFKKPDFSRMPRLDLTKVPRPDFSRIPKPRMPKLKMPKLFQRNQEVSSPQVQNYPNGIRNPKIGGAFGVVQKSEVKFYEIGPSQPHGADEILSQGTVLTIRSNDRSWAYVTLQDGRSGYIGLDQVRFADAKEAPRATSVRSTPQKRSARSSRIASNTRKKAAPPALPVAVVDLPSEPEENPLLGMAEQAGSEEIPMVEEETLPVDSPDVLFDPILDPLDPIPGDLSGGGVEPFLSDPIPSIEEELRAIREAKEAAEAADGGTETDEGGA